MKLNTHASTRALSKKVWSASAKVLGGSTTNRSEALALYRDTLRVTSAFYWADEHGEPWCTRLRREARKEFEKNRTVDDRLEQTRLLLQGRAAVNEITKRFTEMEQQIKRRIDTTKKR